MSCQKKLQYLIHDNFIAYHHAHIDHFNVTGPHFNDYQNSWTVDDLINTKLNDTLQGENIVVCPDCYDELVQDESVRVC